MIKTRSIAGAYLMNGDDFLLLKRSADRKFYPGVWGAVGGHLEPHELNDPQAACLREVLEETGMKESGIEGLSLHYIVFRRSDDEIRISYVFFGRAKSREFVNSDEGELFWIHRNELFDRPMSALTELSLRRYLDLGPEKNVTIGVLNKADEPYIEWLPLVGWEGL